MMPSSRIWIAGTGAIASLFAAKLLRAGVDARLIPRDVEHRASVVFEDGSGELTLPLFEQASVSIDAADYLLVPLKAYDIDAFIAAWAPRLAPQTPVLLLHNGMGGRETLRRYLPSQPLLQGTTRQAALRESRTRIKATGEGLTLIGPAPDNASSTDAQRLQDFYKVLARAVPPMQWQSNITQALWDKLLINAVINPLTALFDIPNGALAEPRYKPLLHAMCHEIVTVMRAAGLHAQDDEAIAVVNDVIHATRANYSSMHQDMQNGRPTEIDAISGYIIHEANKRGLQAPLQQRLYAAISTRQSISFQTLADACAGIE